MSADDQESLARRAHDREREQRIRAWRLAHATIASAVEGFRSSVTLPPAVTPNTVVLRDGEPVEEVA